MIVAEANTAQQTLPCIALNSESAASQATALYVIPPRRTAIADEWRPKEQQAKIIRVGSSIGKTSTAISRPPQTSTSQLHKHACVGRLDVERRATRPGGIAIVERLYAVDDLLPVGYR